MTRKALVVGISIYSHPVVKNLDAFSNNAEAIAQKLKHNCNFEVTRLPAIKGNESEPIIVGKKTPVTRIDLEQAIKDLFLPQGNFPPTTALLYFAGHGIRKTEGFSGGYLVTSDADFEQNWGLSLKELRKLLQDSNITEQIIWLDSCYSSELFNLKEANPGERNNGSRCFIAAATNLAYANSQGNYGVFTQALLKGLNSANHLSGEINNLSLSAFIRQELEKSKFPQTPVFSNFGTAIKLIDTSPSSDTSHPTEIPIICPYQGLEYFTEENHAYFFGRTQLTSQLLSRVEQNNFLAILGASGSGKSSLLRAGLLYELKQGERLSGSKSWQYYLMQPGEKPLQNLALAFVDSHLSKVERATEIERAEIQISKGADGLRRLVQAHDTERVVLIIDQFEEAFTLCQDLAKREAFFQCLLEALVQTDNKLSVILAMRIDFFGKCVERDYSGLGQKIQANLIAIPPMQEEELKQTIIRPAEKVNLSLEPGLTETLLKDIEGSPGSLPLLQDTLTELWKRRQDNQLKFTAYSQLGGIAGTLNQRATEVFDRLNKSEQDAARHIFLALTTLGEGTEDTRRRVLKKDLVTAKHDQQLIDKVVKKLTDEKLIVTRDRVEPNAAIGKQAEVDVAHEALIRNWILLRQWLDECRDLLRQKRKIENAAQEWQNSGQKTDYLLQNKRLKEAKDCQKEQQEQYPLSALAISFVTRSIKQQRNERIKSLGLFLSITLSGTAIGGYVVVREIQLYTDKRLIQDCVGKEYCHGRIEALERLVKAKKSLESYNLGNAYLGDVYLRSANLSNANLSNANLSDAYLRGANLDGVDLSNADLRDINLGNANLDNANLRGAYLRGANLSNVNLDNADLGNASLFGANLNGANLDSVDLSNADLFDAYLRDANLFSANLGNANLVGANFRGADLRGVDLGNTNLVSAYLIESKNLTPSQLKSACYWEKAIYKGHYDTEKWQWIVDKKANQKHIEQLKKDRESDPQELVDCDVWE